MPLAVPASEIGDDLPDRSGEPSTRILDGASSKPTAIVLEEPTAGAAFCPSVLPTCSRCAVRIVDELVVDTTESVGLLGRSCPGGGGEQEAQELLAASLGVVGG
jgi:hypothetical protein